MASDYTPFAPEEPVSSFEYMADLNESQRHAVETTEGPVLILAGAGTGKTKALTTRIAHIINQRLAAPYNILAVTFTNKAAKEMQERVSRLVPHVSWQGSWLGTFHSISARMLRRHANLIGLDQNFVIINQDDQVRLIKQLLSELNLDPKTNPPKLILSMISKWKDKALLPHQVNGVEMADIANGRLAEIYKLYQARLLQLNACDFADLLLHMIIVFQNHSEILVDYHHRFKYMLVDEYQDTNVAQYLWLRLLAQGHRNICCVGDDDQSIYGWRGAEVDNILRFEKDFEGATVIRLEQNYRSTGHILGAASALIAQNEGRLGKTLWTNDEPGDRVFVKGLWDGQEEARWVGQSILSLCELGDVQLKNIAILVRAGFLTREFEEKFMQMGIPYRVYGGLKFYERQEIRDAISYLRLLYQPNDDLAFERIINLPKRGVGPAALKQCHEIAREYGTGCLPAIERVLDHQSTLFKPKLRETFTVFISQMKVWREKMTMHSPGEMIEMILEESGYMEMWKKEGSIEANGRIENLKELASTLSEFENIETFLEHVSLVTDISGETSDNTVTLMTMHAAKGLEFEIVFLPAWEEELFPSRKTIEELGTKGLEEERRLAYVGLTRARKRAFISHAGHRRIHGNWVNSIPSIFVQQLPEEHIHSQMDRSQEVRVQQQFSRQQQQQNNGGGWQQRRSLSQAVDESKKSGVFRIGQKVFHEKFGEGRVVEMDGNKVGVSFNQSGFKKLMASFLRAI